MYLSPKKKSQARGQVSKVDQGLGRARLQKQRDRVHLRSSKQGLNFPVDPAGILWFPVHQYGLKGTQSDQMKENGNPTVTSRPITAQPIPRVSDDL